MSDIPPDLMRVALVLADDAACFGYTQAALDIGHALAAERERCAKVAEALDRRGREWVLDSLWDNIKRDTAAAIRREPTA